MAGFKPLPQERIDFIFESLGEFVPRKGWYNFQCPFHGGDSFKLGINIESQWCSCWVCGYSNPLSTLYKELKEDGYSGTVDRRGILGKGIVRKCEEDTSPGFLNHLNESESSDTPKGLSPDGFLKHLNYLREAPPSIGRGMAQKYLNTRGIDSEDIDIAAIHEDYPGRVIFPFIQNTKLVYFQARSFVNMPLKTLNPSEENGWCPKNEVIWQYDNIKDSIVCLTEGIFDAYTTWKYTDICSIPLLGKNISEIQIIMLRKLGVSEVVVFLDADAMKEAINLALLLYRRKFYVRLITWNIGAVTPDSDPANISISVLRRLVCESYEIDHTSDVLLPLEYV